MSGELETAIVFLGVGNLTGLSLAVLLFARRVTATSRPKDSSAAAGTGPAAAEAPLSPSGSTP